MDTSASSRQLNYPSIRAIFGWLPFAVRRSVAKKCPDVRSMNKKMPHSFRKVEISIEFPYSKLLLDELEWKVLRTGFPVNIVNPKGQTVQLDRYVDIFTITKYFLDRANTRIHTLIAEHCFFHRRYHDFGAIWIERLRIKFAFGKTKPFMKMLENKKFGCIEVVNVVPDATVFKEIEHFQTDSVKVATVKISDESLFNLNQQKVDIYEFETDAEKFTTFCIKLKKGSVGSCYTGDFARSENGISSVLDTLKKNLRAGEKFLNGRKCLHVASEDPDTELVITYEQLDLQESFKYRFTVRVMFNGSAKTPNLRRKLVNAIRSWWRR